MAPWRELGYWNTDSAHKFGTFVFGCAAFLKRPVFVLEQSPTVDGVHVLDPLKCYGARVEDSLRRSTAAPLTIPSWFETTFDELIAALRSGLDCSVLLHDGDVCTTSRSSSVLTHILRYATQRSLPSRAASG